MQKSKLYESFGFGYVLHEVVTLRHHHLEVDAF